MRRLTVAVICLLVLVGLVVPAQAWHYRHHIWYHSGWVWAIPPPVYYPPYVVVPSPPVVERRIIIQEPTVYVERPGPEASYWYFCRDPEGYHPYIAKCNLPWLQVVPQLVPK